MNQYSFILLLLSSSLADVVWSQFTSSICSDRRADSSPLCTPTSSSFCSEIYSDTYYPNNITGDAVVAETGLRLYSILWNSLECSPFSQVFICLALSPKCERSIAYQPCAELCSVVSAACSTAIQENQLEDIGCLLNCDRYPSTNCIGLDDPLVAGIMMPSLSTPSTTRAPQTAVTTDIANSTGECPAEKYFNDSAKSFALGWLAFWSIICFVSTILTIATFLLNPARFPYPWRPVVYLALSFNLHSLTHFLAMVLGRDLVTCPGGNFVQTSMDWTWGHTPCILVFALLYFTMMTAFLWWLMLSLSWFLASTFSWSSEAVAQLAPLYHIIAWVLPLLLTIILVATRVVSADELTGTCFILREDNHVSFLALLLGVIIPLVLCLIVGVVLLTIGFASIIRVRAVMRSTGKAAESSILEKLMIRIGVFVVVFIIPACVVIGCFIYELVSQPSWTPLSVRECDNCARANPAVFMTRLFMFLLTGILTGVWIWSKKTVNSWRSFPARVTSCCQPTPDQAVPSAMNAYVTDENIYSSGNGELEMGSTDVEYSEKL